MLPHLLPYLLFALLTAGADHLPPALVPWVDPARTLRVGATLVVFWRRRSYPELHRPVAEGPAPPRGGAVTGAVAAVALGALLGLTWPWLTALGGSLGPGRSGFDPGAAGTGAVPVLWTARLLGTVAVVPLAEELFVRDLLPRMTDALRADGHWRDRAVGAFTPLSAAVSLGFFVLTHPEWLAALVTGALWTWLLWRGRRLGHVVLSHAAANGALAAYVIATGETWLW